MFRGGMRRLGVVGSNVGVEVGFGLNWGIVGRGRTGFGRGGVCFASSGAASTRLSALREALSHGPSLGEFARSSPPPTVAGTSLSKKGGDVGRKPEWLRIRGAAGKSRQNVERLMSTVKDRNLATVCEEAQCPNLSECWGGREGTATATIMLMGDTCTRGCSFCAVATSPAPAPLDPHEPENVAKSLAEWGLGYVVLTSVDRDDLPDQGAGHLKAVIQEIKKTTPDLLVECLAPDFQGKDDLVGIVATSGLDVFAHNLETVERLQPRVRDRRAGYHQSLHTLEAAKRTHQATNPPSPLITKTSIMLGLGETVPELQQTMRDARSAGVDVITFGQYLRPSKRHHPIVEYVHPDVFEALKRDAEDMGFLYVASGPLVRSSYKAGEFFLEGELRRRKGEAQVATVESNN